MAADPTRVLGHVPGITTERRRALSLPQVLVLGTIPNAGRLTPQRVHKLSQKQARPTKAKQQNHPTVTSQGRRVLTSPPTLQAHTYQLTIGLSAPSTPSSNKPHVAQTTTQDLRGVPPLSKLKVLRTHRTSLNIQEVNHASADPCLQ